MHPSAHHKLQPPPKFHRCYLHSVLRYLDEAPRIFFGKKIFMQQPYLLPRQSAIVDPYAHSGYGPPGPMVFLHTKDPMHAPSVHSITKYVALHKNIRRYYFMILCHLLGIHSYHRYYCMTLRYLLGIHSYRRTYLGVEPTINSCKTFAPVTSL